MIWAGRMLAAVGLVSLTLLVGCGSASQPSPSVPARAKGTVAPAGYLDEVAREAALAGGSPLEELASGAGIPGDSLSAFIAIPAERCALVFARGPAQVEDLDLYLFADDGDEVAASDDTHAPPTLLYCAKDRPERLLAVARIAAGRGSYALGLVDAPLAKEADLRERLLAKRDEPTAPAEDFPAFTAGLEEHRDTLGGSWRDVRRVLVPVDHRVPTQLDFSVSQGRCVDAFLLPGDHVDDLDVEAVDAQGRTFARAEARGSQRALLVCAGADAGTVTLRLRPHAGRGVVVLALSETKHAGTTDLHPEFPRYDLSPGPATLPTLAPAGRRLELAVDRLTSHPLSWTGCQRIELEPRWPLLGYRLAAYDGSGQLVAERAGTGPARFYLCLPKSAGGDGHLQLRATSRAGPLDLRSIAETPSAAPTLQRAPLAAGRLLGLADDLGFLKEASDIGQVSLHALEPDRLVRIPLSVPAERCLTILAAADRSGRGIELGLVDSSTARFVDFARGSNVASVRACGARGRTEDLIVELRAPYGETTALVATRQEELTPRSAALPR